MYMTGRDFDDQVREIQRANEDTYGNHVLGFEFRWDGNTIDGIDINFPSYYSLPLDEAFRYSEAIQGMCKDLNKLIGAIVES